MKRAFTLIELLVVIAIIAILAAILFPVFARAKEAAKITRSLTQMKQLATSIMIYAGDHDDFFAPASNRSLGPGIDPIIWPEITLPYVKNKEIYIAVDSNGAFPANWGARRQGTIGYSDATGVDSDPAFAGTPGAAAPGTEGFLSGASFSAAEEAAKTVLFATTPGAPIGNNSTKHRGYVFNPYNGLNSPDGDYYKGLPKIADRDLVVEFGDVNYPNSPNDSAGLNKPIFARYRANKDNTGVSPLIFADGHCKVVSAKAMNVFGNYIWRFR